MASYFIVLAFLQAVVLQVAYGQCLNRIVPNCGPNVFPVTETILPSPVIFNQAPNVIPSMPIALPGQTIIPQVAMPGMPATTIIQDSTVSNNLANALQLLVVSNLLSNTLPTANEVVLPGAPVEVISGLSPMSMPVPSFGNAVNYLF